MAAKSQKDPTIYLVINFLVLLPFVFRDWDTQYHFITLFLLVALIRKKGTMLAVILL